MVDLAPHCRFSHLSGKRLHLSVCGSVAAFRALDLLRLWKQAGIQVSATLSQAAQRFVTPLSFEALGAAPVYGEMFAADAPFGHLEPGQCAQAMVIAPATAATLSRLAHGQADSMIACQALAFAGPLLLAPAMNPRMWQHPATQENLQKLCRRGAWIVAPGCGSTACGDTGQGRLAALQDICLAAMKALSPQDMAGKKVMVTLGPTREQWDAVRYWSNPSTGIMGASLALAAWLRGAEVTAICGPGCPELPETIRRINVTTAREMFDAAEAVWPAQDMGIFTAAVADFSPEPFGTRKFKKNGHQDGFQLRFLPNPDILKTLARRRRPEQKILGFAAETVADLGAAVRGKRADKNATVLAGNHIGGPDSAFGRDENRMVVVDAFGREEHWPVLPKPEVAWRLCSWLLECG